MVNGELRIEMLGSLRVKMGEETAVFRTDAERILLAFLAAQQGSPQRRDTLAGLLSPDRPDKEALTYLRNRLTRLRSFICDDTATPPYLDIDRKQITLRTGDDIVVDVVQFAQGVAAVEAHQHRQLAGCPVCLTQLDAVVALVRGEFLAGLNFPSETWQAWLTAQREHIQQRALAAIAQLREAKMQLGEWTAVLDLAQRQLQLEPWLEAAHRAVMTAHAHLGDRTAALAQFEQCQQILWDELGVEPEAETEALRQQIFEGELWAEATAVPNNLPHPTSPFFGREAEQTQLLQRLVDPNYRLVTLVGTGGIGKTRLAIEVGRQVKTSFPDGVWFVSLEAVQGGAEQIKIAVGEALGLAQDDRQLTGEQVLAILRDKQLLLIFDNSEVALDDLAFIPEWLRRAPHIAILATSREPLNFQAESVVTLDGLPLPWAAALFAERGQMARADFAVTAENVAQVRHICQLVGGSPLGIALAAAWVRRRSLAQIIEGIGQSLDFLSTRLRDVDPRHRSVRAVFEASWQLLAPAEQDVLAALSVFPAGFTAVSAQAIANATPLDLDLLCEKSLLQQQLEPARYEMHSLLRQFAADKLAARTPEAERAFVAYFFQFAHDHQADYPALQPEWRNLLAGVQKAHHLAAWQAVLDFVEVLYKPWQEQLRLSDIHQGVVLALEAATQLQNEIATAQTLLRLGKNAIGRDDHQAAKTALSQALQRFMKLEDSPGIADTYYLLGRIEAEQGQNQAAIERFESSKRIFAAEGDLLGMAKNLNLIADCLISEDPTSQAAQARLEESISLQRNLPMSPAYVEALLFLARINGNLEQYDVAESYLIKATRASQEQNDIGNTITVLFERTVLCRRLNQLNAAIEFGETCLHHVQKIGSLRWQGLVKTQLGLIHQAQENFQEAQLVFQQGLQIFVELGDLFEQALLCYCLHRLSEETDELQLSLKYKQEAIKLNLELENPWLAELLQ